MSDAEQSANLPAKRERGVRRSRARQIVAAIESRRAELIIGRAERVFVRLNALWPKLVDRGLAKTTKKIRDLVKPAA